MPSGVHKQLLLPVGVSFATTLRMSCCTSTARVCTLLPSPTPAACCIYELYTGQPLFAGVDENDMMWRMQMLRGPLPHRLIRAHLRQVEAFGFDAHFDSDLHFVQHVVDPVRGHTNTHPPSPSPSLEHTRLVMSLHPSRGRGKAHSHSAVSCV